MNNEYSAENLYKLGSSENKLRTARSDNDIDIITKELRSSESLLSQIVSFEAVYQKNVSDKMKMLNRININKADRTMDTRAKLRKEGVKL